MIHKGFYFESVILLFFFARIKADWGSPDSSQYHIQTDEGPERFFRFQTDSGQFRNEKRLRDGTVIGTEAWIDDAGYLRQKDYIADKDGYRILKNKTIFVGKGRPIKDVISNGRVNTNLIESTSTTTQSTPLESIPNYLNVPRPNTLVNDNDYGYPKKKTPSILVHFNAEPIDGSPNAQNVYIPPSSTPAPPPTVTTYTPIFSSTSTALPLTSTPYLSTTTSTPSPDTHSPAISIPSKYFLPPFSHADDSPIIRIKAYSPLPTPVSAYTIAEINNEFQPPFSTPATSIGGVYNHQSDHPIVAIPATASTLNHIDNIGPSHAWSSSSYSPHTPTAAPTIVINENRNSNLQSPNGVPLFNRNTFYRGKRPISYQYYQPNQLDYGDGSRKPFDRYSARTENGFSYFLPRQYHEESYARDPQNRDGSFGYIDPFGIRRVVYYQASPEHGFKVRKNNRYVGFNAKPYDSK